MIGGVDTGLGWAVHVDDLDGRESLLNACHERAAEDFAAVVFFFFLVFAAVVGPRVIAPQVSTAARVHKATTSAIPNRRMYSP